MPRTARVLLPCTPHHVVQRGHNRERVFATPGDFRAYLDDLREWKAKLGIAVHAYCIMTNHVHLVLRPGDDVSTVGALMRRLAGRHTRRINTTVHRTGTAWEGRYKASPIQTDLYLLACTRYVELNPVRARLVNQPADYPWSSYRLRTDGRGIGWLDPDECYLSLGCDGPARSTAYAEFVAAGIDEVERSLIHTAVNRNQLTGDERFVTETSARIGHSLPHRGPGRPKSAPERGRTSEKGAHFLSS